MATEDTSRSDAAVILNKEDVELSFIAAEIPGSKPTEDPIAAFLGGGNGLITPPIDPTQACKAVASNGELAAVGQAVADGAAGMQYEIKPRFNRADVEFDINSPKSWPPDVKDQHDRLQVVMQAGFMGKGAQSLRVGFREQEHDRFVLGWGGVLVHREALPEDDGMPARPRGFGRFEARYARFTGAQATPTMVPVPIALQDGRILWIEEPRHFRRILFSRGQKNVWYKQYGDWRAMDSRTGNYGRGSRRKPPPTPFVRGSYLPGVLPSGAVPAKEVMHWATTFPGADPYGVSGWHSEILSVHSALEATKLVLSYLRSGLHSVILAASNRPFEQASVTAAVDKIDKLGRGREGLGSLVTISLVPAGSDSAAAARPFSDESSADRGRLVLHELNTRIPSEVVDGTLKSSLATSFSNSERIPAILLGKSEAYNFATASAAWMVVNRLRFRPHHEERESFMDRVLVEMAITWWRIAISSPEWEEKDPTAGVAAIAGQNGGISANHALELLARVLDIEVVRIEEWWAKLPMPIVAAVLGSADPVGTLRVLGQDDAADHVADRGIGDVPGAAGKAVDALNEAAAARVAAR